MITRTNALPAHAYARAFDHGLIFTWLSRPMNSSQLSGSRQSVDPAMLCLADHEVIQAMKSEIEMTRKGLASLMSMRQCA